MSTAVADYARAARAVLAEIEGVISEHLREAVAHEREFPGCCFVCSKSDQCPGHAVLGLHCWGCRTQLTPANCVRREEDMGFDDEDALIFVCPTCGEENPIYDREG